MWKLTIEWGSELVRHGRKENVLVFLLQDSLVLLFLLRDIHKDDYCHRWAHDIRILHKKRVSGLPIVDLLNWVLLRRGWENVRTSHFLRPLSSLDSTLNLLIGSYLAESFYFLDLFIRYVIFSSAWTGIWILLNVQAPVKVVQRLLKQLLLWINSPWDWKCLRLPSFSCLREQLVGP